MKKHSVAFQNKKICFAILALVIWHYKANKTAVLVAFALIYTYLLWLSNSVKNGLKNKTLKG